MEWATKQIKLIWIALAFGLIFLLRLISAAIKPRKQEEGSQFDLSEVDGAIAYRRWNTPSAAIGVREEGENSDD